MPAPLGCSRVDSRVGQGCGDAPPSARLGGPATAERTLQLVIAIILSGLISVTALAFGITFLLGAGDEATSDADNRAGTWLMLAIGVGLAVGTVVALRRQARRWEAGHGSAVPTVPLRWRP